MSVGGGKVCKDCGEDKDLDDFFRDSSNRSGYRAECKSCTIQRRIDMAGSKEEYNRLQADYMAVWRGKKRPH